MTKAYLIGMLCLALSATTARADDAKPDDKAGAKTDDKAPAKTDASAEVKAGTGVEKHEVVGEAATFPPGTTVWAWSRVTGAEGSIKHVWKKDGKELWTATLPVGSKKWTTQSRRALQAAGSYEVEVQTADGASLGTVQFKIE